MSLPAGRPVYHAPDNLAEARAISTINPVTGLSTDYLNHFTEAIMVLEMAAAMPECLEDLRTWRPKTYREHFATSRFTGRDAVIAAYDAADPSVRHALDSVAETLNTVLLDTRDVFLGRQLGPDTEVPVRRAVNWLKPLIARAASIINGACEARGTTQAAIDSLFAR